MNYKKDIFKSKEDKWDFIIALVLILFFSVFIYYYLFTDEEKVAINTPTELEEVEEKPIETITEKDKYLYTNSTTYKTETIKVEDAYESEKDSAIIISDIIKTSIPVKDVESESIVNKEIEVSESNISKDIIETESIVDKDIEESIETTNEISTASELTIDIEEPIIELKTEQEEVKPEPVSPQVDTLQKNNTETFNCIIVVGAFKELKNKTAIINKLKTLGYDHRTGVLRNGLNYVGVPVACNNRQENLKLLTELNQALGIQSWIKRVL